MKYLKNWDKKVLKAIGRGTLGIFTFKGGKVLEIFKDGIDVNMDHPNDYGCIRGYGFEDCSKIKILSIIFASSTLEEVNEKINN